MKRIVGIDIGTYAVKVLHLDLKAEVSVLGFDQELVAVPVEAASAPAPTPPPVPGDDETTAVREAPVAPEPEIVGDSTPGWVAALQRLGERGALQGEHAVAFMPDGEAMTIQVDVPFADRAKAMSVLPHLLMDRLPLPQGQLVWDFHAYAKDDEDGARALVGFAPDAAVAQALERFGGAGVDPTVLGLPELMMATAAIEALGGPRQEPIAFIDLGHRTTRLVVVKGRRPRLARTIRRGGHEITEALAKKFNATYEEAQRVKHEYGAIVAADQAPNEQTKALGDAVAGALAPLVREIRRSLQGLYATEKVEVSEVFVFGGTSRIRNIESHLAGELGLKVRRLNFGSLATIADPQAAPLAYGAARTYHDEGARSRAINLRRGRFAFRGKSSYLRRQVAILAAGVFALLLIFGFTMLMQKSSYEAQRDAMKTALSNQTKRMFGEPVLSKSEIQKRLAGEEVASASFVPKMSAYELLHELTQAISKDITLSLDRIEVDADRNLVQIYGETTDAQAVDRLVSDLEKIKCLKEIRKDKLTVKGEKADFELQISSECS